MAKPTLLEKTTYALSAKLLYYVHFAFCNGNREKKKNYPMSRHAFRKYKILGTTHLHVHVMYPATAVTSYVKQNIKLGRGR